MLRGKQTQLLRSFSGGVFKPKRFYQQASTQRVDQRGWKVFLDDKEVKTPARTELIVPSQTLAELIAEEFDAQKEIIFPATMPIMTITSTALDVTRQNIPGTVERIIQFLQTDTVCFMSEDEPELNAAQTEAWDPLRRWALTDFGILVGQSQGLQLPSESGVPLLRKYLEGLDFWDLTCQEIATSYSKSAVIALAFLRGSIDVQKAVDAALVEEKWQRRNWGTVEGCHDVAEREMAMWLAACDTVSKVVRG